jgi:eukaryotic-like serine/threonine-protein kinase
MESHGVVFGASRDVLDVRVTHSKSEKLRTNRSAQVDIGFVSGLPDDDPVCVATRPRDLHRHVARDLEAAWTDTRPNRSAERGPSERLDRRGHHLRDHSAPSHVRRRHAPTAGIGEKERQAVGHPHPDGDLLRRAIANLARDDRVCFGARRRVRLDAAAPVHLPRLNDDIGAQISAKLRVFCAASRKRVGEAFVPKELRAQKHGRPDDAPSRLVIPLRGYPMRPQDPFIGRDILNGSFQILQKIGSGGMGAVYRALQPQMNRMVGVKILHPKLANRKDLVSRFRREARAMSQLTHPNTTKVFLYGELDDGSLYIIMEFLEGKNLNQTVRADGPFPMDRALPVLIQVCGALDEAHRAGIIHRDLKPENIFLVQSAGLRDFAKVLDFGLAKVGERQMRPGSVILTQEGMVFGTPEFMSPEQAQGKSLTPASDIYSLAVILYEVLTGKLPFDAKSPMDYIQLHVTGKPVPLNQRAPGKVFPPLLEQVIERALAKRPEERFSSAADFASAMQQVLEGAEQLAPQLAPKGGNELPTMPLRPVGGPLAAALNAQTSKVDPGGTTSATTTIPDPQPLHPHSPAPITSRSRKTNLVLLVGIALAFMLLGVGLAVVLMRFVIH